MSHTVYIDEEYLQDFKVALKEFNIRYHTTFFVRDGIIKMFLIDDMSDEHILLIKLKYLVSIRNGFESNWK